MLEEEMTQHTVEGVRTRVNKEEQLPLMDTKQRAFVPCTAITEGQQIVYALHLKEHSAVLCPLSFCCGATALIYIKY